MCAKIKAMHGEFVTCKLWVDEIRGAHMLTRVPPRLSVSCNQIYSAHSPPAPRPVLQRRTTASHCSQVANIHQSPSPMSLICVLFLTVFLWLSGMPQLHVLHFAISCEWNKSSQIHLLIRTIDQPYRLKLKGPRSMKSVNLVSGRNYIVKLSVSNKNT